MSSLKTGLGYLLPDTLTSDTNATTYCDSFPCVGSIAEPMTMITDYILTVELFALSALLLRRGPKTPVFARYFAAGFAVLGVSFAFGGSEHGFALALKCDGRDACKASSWVWIITLLTQTPGLALPVVGAAALVVHTPLSVFVAKTYAAMITAVFSVLALIGAASGWNGFLVGFQVVILFSFPSVISVLVLFSLPVCYNRAAGAPPKPGQTTALGGWVVCLCSLVWQASGIDFHEHLNHNDIFHMIFMVGLGLTYLGLKPQLDAAPEGGDVELQGGMLFQGGVRF